MPKGPKKGEGSGPPDVLALALPGISAIDRLRKLDDAKVAEIAVSLTENGQLQPILVRPDPDVGAGYRLIAGHHRFAAARSLGWETIEAKVVEMDDIDARLAEIDENLARGELSPAERGMHVAERKRLYLIHRPDTAHGAVSGFRGNQHTKPKEVSRQVGDLPKADRFTAETAKATGRSERSLQRDAHRGEKVGSLQKVVGTTLDNGEELDALARMPKPAQEAIIARAEAGEKVSAKIEIKKLARAEKESALAEKIATLSTTSGSKLYGVIYADPEWQFDVYSRETGLDRSADNHYPTSALDIIKARKIPAADDCVCFLWATVPMLPHALEVLAAWGFEYKSAITWAKDRTGTGYWLRNQTEHLLIGTRGTVPAPAPGTQPSSLIEAPLGAHSEKPAVFREIIEKMFPTLAKLEMNARVAAPNWDAWGAEAPEQEAAE